MWALRQIVQSTLTTSDNDAAIPRRDASSQIRPNCAHGILATLFVLTAPIVALLMDICGGSHEEQKCNLEGIAIA